MKSTFQGINSIINPTGVSSWEYQGFSSGGKERKAELSDRSRSDRRTDLGYTSAIFERTLKSTLSSSSSSWAGIAPR